MLKSVNTCAIALVFLVKWEFDQVERNKENVQNSSTCNLFYGFVWVSWWLCGGGVRSGIRGEIKNLCLQVKVSMCLIVSGSLRRFLKNAQNDQIDDLGAFLWGDMVINGFLTF